MSMNLTIYGPVLGGFDTVLTAKIKSQLFHIKPPGIDSAESPDNTTGPVGTSSNSLSSNSE